jgi:hypothetical protein
MGSSASVWSRLQRSVRTFLLSDEPPEWFWRFPGGQPTVSGATVTDQTALRVTAVLSCVKVLADSISTLPLMAFERQANGDKRAVAEHPLSALGDVAELAVRINSPGGDPAAVPDATLVRPYQGREVQVTVLENGFRHDGKESRSLSKLASEITGNSTNGLLWFRLTERPAATPKAAAPKRKGTPAATEAGPEPAPAPASATA